MTLHEAPDGSFVATFALPDGRVARVFGVIEFEVRKGADYWKRWAEKRVKR